MAGDGRVLLRSRRQRVIEALLLPALLLPVGPALRLLLGDRYNPMEGIGAALLVLLLMSKLGTMLGPRLGGVFLSPEERMSRLLAEMRATPAWRAVALQTVTVGGMVGAVLLTIGPVDELGGTFGGPGRIAGYLVFLAAIGGLQTLLTRRRLAGAVIVADAPPAGETLRESLRLLPRYYAAWLTGAVVGVLAARQLGEPRWLTCVVASLSVSQLLMFLLRSGTAIRTLYTAQATQSLGRLVIAMIACWGIPMAILMTGMQLAEPDDRAPIWLLLLIAVVIALGGGAAMGVLMRLILGLSDGRRRSPG